MSENLKNNPHQSPEITNIDSIQEIINQNNSRVDEIINIKDKETKYNLLLENYLNSGEEIEIIQYFKTKSNLELIDFIQNHLFKSKAKGKIEKLASKIIMKLVSLYERQNSILLFLLKDLKIKNIGFGNRYESNPLNFLEISFEKCKIELNGKTYYQVSQNYYTSYDFGKNSDGEVEKILEIKNNFFIEKNYSELKNDKKINFFGEKNLDLILKLSHIPKIRKFIKEYLLVEINNISLKSQVNLFKYLIECDYEKISEYNQIIGKNWDIHNEIQEAFFALGESKKLSQKILNIAKSDIPQKLKKSIFTKYKSLINEIEKGTINNSEEKYNLDSNLLFKEAVSKINTIFKDIDKILNPIDFNIIKKLESGNIKYGTTFKTLKEHKEKSEDNSSSIDLIKLKEIEQILENTKSEYIEAGLIFKKLKDSKINSLDELKSVGIDYKKISLSDLNPQEKNKILEDFMSLYKENYNLKTQADFLKEIENGLKNILNQDKENTDFYMFYINGKAVLTSYLKTLENGEIYCGGFNAKSSFQQYNLGFWVFEKIITEQLNKGKKLNWTVTKEIKNNEIFEKNKHFKALLRIYQNYGAKVISEGENNNSKFLRLKLISETEHKVS